MNLTPTSDPVWVSTALALRRMVDDLAKYPALAVDTESNSLFVYQEQVCLIQFSTGERDYLVDPLSLKDLSILACLFTDSNIQKIFHAAEYDVICLKRDFGFEFENVFDTMIAGRTLGRNEIGLGSMIEVEFGVHLDKRYQRANWGKRPLPKPQLDYARLDTFYLLPLRDRLQMELEKAGRFELAQEDFRRVCHTSIPQSSNNGAPCWRISGSQDLTPQQAAVLAELCQYREQQAQRADVPQFKILGNQVLLDLANDLPQTWDDLCRVKGLSRGNIERHGVSLLKAVERGLNSKPIHRPHNGTRPDEAYMARLDALRSWRKQSGVKMGVPSDVILPREVMEQIAQKKPASYAELEIIMEDLPWRLKQFGKEIFDTINR